MSAYSWSHNLRSGAWDDVSDDSDAENDGPRTPSDALHEDDFDISVREDQAQYKANPWSIAKINAATRSTIAKEPTGKPSTTTRTKPPARPGALHGAFAKQMERQSRQSTKPTLSSRRADSPVVSHETQNFKKNDILSVPLETRMSSTPSSPTLLEAAHMRSSRAIPGLPVATFRLQLDGQPDGTALPMLDEVDQLSELDPRSKMRGCSDREGLLHTTEPSDDVLPHPSTAVVHAPQTSARTVDHTMSVATVHARHTTNPQASALCTIEQKTILEHIEPPPYITHKDVALTKLKRGLAQEPLYPEETNGAPPDARHSFEEKLHAMPTWLLDALPSHKSPRIEPMPSYVGDTSPSQEVRFLYQQVTPPPLPLETFDYPSSPTAVGSSPGPSTSTKQRLNATIDTAPRPPFRSSKPAAALSHTRQSGELFSAASASSSSVPAPPTSPHHRLIVPLPAHAATPLNPRPGARSDAYIFFDNDDPDAQWSTIARAKTKTKQNPAFAGTRKSGPFRLALNMPVASQSGTPRRAGNPTKKAQEELPSRRIIKFLPPPPN